ncbi:DNA cytosine methyltransferase [Mycobacterium sp. DL99]|uniref:DNA cytosine methyltransferase n=1 Tax=Mycobacterium sp. DL99 TaxID=2528957 RepID=UPI0025711232|nr:DNA cytosine methyltransferase [Mycobacterium sp. DL99]
MRLIRGPFVKLAPHRDHVEDIDSFVQHAMSVRRATGAPLAADFFSGAGGLSLGLESAGFKIVFGADHEPFASRTHAHHFGGMSVDWDLSDPSVVARLGDLMREAEIDLIAGGPPCQPFSKAGRSMIRYRVQTGLRDPHDERRDLWRSFLEIVDRARPKAVLMENVPDMALDREMFILRSMVEELEQMSYSVEERVVDTWRYGVPQFRQRLILVALQGNTQFRWPTETARKVTVWNAIGDLPEVEGGWRPEGGEHGWADYAGPITAYQREMRGRIAPVDSNKVFDHITRPVRDDDREAFESMTHATKYTDLDKEHQRYRGDIFDDKYNRLNENDLSRTITAHIAKDGYWYIHPRQSRTLTVREAARLQTFPDDFRFDGPPSAAFRQIGNAVPPRLGFVMGQAIRESLDNRADAGLSTRECAQILARWMSKSKHVRALPWLQRTPGGQVSRWLVIAAEELLDRAPKPLMRRVWKLLQENNNPWALSKAKQERFDEYLDFVVENTGREARLERMQGLRDRIATSPQVLNGSADDLRSTFEIAESVADLAVLAAPVDMLDASGAGPEEPVLVTKGVLRVVSRFQGSDVDRRNRLTDGRLAVARMVGFGTYSRDAHLGLIELANSWCRPTNPECTMCPLQTHCVEGRRTMESSPTLY